MQPEVETPKPGVRQWGNHFVFTGLDDPQFQAELRAFIEETVADQIRRRGSIAQAVEALVRARLPGLLRWLDR